VLGSAVRQTRGNHPSSRDLRIMAGVLSMLPHDAELAGVVQRCVVLPRTESMRVVLRGAQRRGEVAADRDVDMLATVVLAMITYHLVVTAEPIDEAFISLVLSEVVLPASLADRVREQP
jgi:hypothetical protein